MGATLSRLGYVDDQKLTQFVAKQYSLPSINLGEIEIDAAVLKLVPRDICEKHNVIPVRRNGPTLIVAMADPSNIYAIDELKFLTQYNIEPVVASEGALEAALSRYYDKGPDLDQMMGEFDVDNVDFTANGEADVNVVDLENQAGEAPVVKLCNAIMLSAIKKKASDIHVEPYEKSFRVRFRIDGILQEEMRPPLKLRNAITSRLKIMASLDIAERRLPQDGRIKLKNRHQQGDGLPRVGLADAVRREDRHASPRQDDAAARHDEARLRCHAADVLQDGDLEALRHGAGDGTDRIRQDHHAVLGALGAQHHRPKHFNGRGSGRVPPARGGADPDPGGDRLRLRDVRCERSCATTPNIIMVGEIRDRETAEIRDPVGAHRPPGAGDAAHQRRTVDGVAPPVHGHRSRSS